jgi:uncharacterized membrane protein
MEIPIVDRIGYAAQRLLAILVIAVGSLCTAGGLSAILFGTTGMWLVSSIIILTVFGLLPVALGVLLLRRVRRAMRRDAEQAAEGTVRQLARRGDGTFTAHDLAACGTTLREAQRILHGMQGYGFVEYAPSADGAVRYRLPNG